MQRLQEIGRKVRKLLSKVLNRLTITAALLVLQALFLWAISYRLGDYARWINPVLLALSVFMCAAMIRQDSTAPEFKISWMVLFILMPIQGGLLYLLWGDKRPAFRLRRQLEKAAGEVEPLRRPDPAAQKTLERLSPRAARTSAYLRDYAAYPVCAGTEVKYYPSGEAVYADLLPALEKAERFIFIEFFIITSGEMWDSVHEILRRKAAQGVDVRVIYDDVGCATGLPVAYWRTLEQEGIHAVPFNPFLPVLNMVMNSRDHRKIVAVDGSVAFTGGFNLADEYINRKERFGHWRDTAVRLEGPGAWNFAAMFMELWSSQHAQDPGLSILTETPRPAPRRTVGLVQPYADSPVDGETVAKNVYLELINQAQKTLWITTPYLILDNAMLTALRLAAKRGVDVRIYVPGTPDKKMVYELTKSFFAPLLRGGVKIFTYTPGFLHAKTWLVDGEIAAVGSINLDYRSLYLHFECSVLLYHCPALADVAEDMMDIERLSHPVALAECHTGPLGTMVSAILRLLAPLC